MSVTFATFNISLKLASAEFAINGWGVGRSLFFSIVTSLSVPRTYQLALTLFGANPDETTLHTRVRFFAT